MEPQRLPPPTEAQRVLVPGPLAAKSSPSQTWCDSHSHGVEGHAGSPTRPGQTPLPDSSPPAGQQRREARSRTSTTCPAAREAEGEEIRQLNLSASSLRNHNPFSTYLYSILTFLYHILTNCSLGETGKGLNGPLVLRLLVPKPLELYLDIKQVPKERKARLLEYGRSLLREKLDGG